MNQVVTKEAIAAQGRGSGVASQATHVEQSRAVAQVQGALVVARHNPRDEIAAVQRVREACAVPALAERAFFRFNRGDGAVSGASIHLATELARCWGNVDFGIVELARNDAKGESEMLAVAWDLETNTRVTNSFIVPHKRDKRGGAVALTDMRDIYENNANQAARRLRECIFRIVPTYLVEEAKTRCRETLEHGGGVSLPERREKLLAVFNEIGVGRKRLEKKVGLSADRFTAVDVANLGIIYQSIRRGEVAVDYEFPEDKGEEVAAELRQKAKKALPEVDVAELQKVARDVATMGAARLDQHMERLSDAERAALQPILPELQRICAEADADAPADEPADEQGATL